MKGETMFKRLWNLFFYCKKKPSAIIEPVGGINGLSWGNAETFTYHGYRVRRWTWEGVAFVEWDFEHQCFCLRTGEMILQPEWKCFGADYVSCDWVVCGKKSKD